MKKCPYCDFNSYAITPGLKREVPYDEAAYTSALCAEMRLAANDARWKGRTIESVFFGGGTPSIFSPTSIAEIISTARGLFSLAPDCEITLETNPGTVTEEVGAEKIFGFRTAGATRISLGVQSFSASKLSVLGRLHTPDDVFRAVSLVQSAEYCSWNLDLMFGVATETLAAWESDLDQALNLEPPHISLYGLTIEPGTEFAVAVRKGTMSVPDEELQADGYTLAQSKCSTAKRFQYEISNFALPGHECRHNDGYWLGKDYLGLGAGAHSYCRIPVAAVAQQSAAIYATRWSNIPLPSHYIERIRDQQTAAQRFDPVRQDDAVVEYISLRLRRRDGIDEADLRRTFTVSLPEVWWDQVEALRGDGLLTQTGLALTERGFLFSDYVIERLIDLRL